MPFYLRKSVSVGPLRFNLSKSGVGVSAGIPGFRVGSGPRGNYVHVGRGGLYYRKTLSGGRRRGSAPVPRSEGAVVPDALEEIRSGSAAAMSDASSEDFLAELRRKRKRIEAAPWIALAGLVGFFLGLRSEAGDGALLASLSAVLVSLPIGLWESWRRKTVLLYDLESEAEADFQRLYEALEGLRSVQRVWRTTARGETGDLKRNAGASHAIRRTLARTHFPTPPGVRTNLSIPSLDAGKQRLFLFPERMLVFEGLDVGAVSYDQLELVGSSRRFVEDERVPSDATQVDTTWQYVNRDGGPDRRFNNNRQLPVLQYGSLELSSPSGLRVEFQLSKEDAGRTIANAIERYRDALRHSSSTQDRPASGEATAQPAGAEPQVAPEPAAPVAQSPPAESTPVPSHAPIWLRVPGLVIGWTFGGLFVLAGVFGLFADDATALSVTALGQGLLCLPPADRLLPATLPWAVRLALRLFAILGLMVVGGLLSTLSIGAPA